MQICIAWWNYMENSMNNLFLIVFFQPNLRNRKCFFLQVVEILHEDVEPQHFLCNRVGCVLTKMIRKTKDQIFEANWKLSCVLPTRKTKFDSLWVKLYYFMEKLNESFLNYFLTELCGKVVFKSGDFKNSSFFTFSIDYQRSLTLIFKGKFRSAKYVFLYRISLK